MPHDFVHVPHPHVAARSGPVVSGARDAKAVGVLARFNLRVGVGVTRVVGSMWCAWSFCGLALISLPSALLSGSVLVIVAWIAQTFLQLVLLPVIMVGQDVAQRAGDARSEQTYKDAEAILHECAQVQAHLTHQDQFLRDALTRVGEQPSPSPEANA